MINQIGGSNLLDINMEQLMENKILLVDDEEDILNVLETVLIKEGFKNIYKAENGKKAIEKASKLHPDIIILDIMLPDINGYEVCQKIRQFTYVPIIFLSAKSDDVDKLLGLGIGGDDYVTKPFSPKEVAYRIKAQFRRQQQVRNVEKEELIVHKFGKIEVDPLKVEVRKADEVVMLTALEYQLLQLFIRHPNQILSKETIIEHIWGDYFEGIDNTLMVHIHHLRHKIEEHPSKPQHILTQRGLGYKFVTGGRR